MLLYLTIVGITKPYLSITLLPSVVCWLILLVSFPSRPLVSLSVVPADGSSKSLPTDRWRPGGGGGGGRHQCRRPRCRREARASASLSCAETLGKLPGLAGLAVTASSCTSSPGRSRVEALGTVPPGAGVPTGWGGRSERRRDGGKEQGCGGGVGIV